MAITFQRDERGVLYAYRDGVKVGPIYSTGDEIPVEEPEEKEKPEEKPEK